MASGQGVAGRVGGVSAERARVPCRAMPWRGLRGGGVPRAAAHLALWLGLTSASRQWRRFASRPASTNCTSPSTSTSTRSIATTDIGAATARRSGGGRCSLGCVTAVGNCRRHPNRGAGRSGSGTCSTRAGCDPGTVHCIGHTIHRWGSWGHAMHGWRRGSGDHARLRTALPWLSHVTR